MKDQSKYVVKLSRDIVGVSLSFWVYHVFSYRKGNDGALLTASPDLAHQYRSEATAHRAAEAFGGVIETI